jgi:anti-sigma B factor antagonist
MTDNAGPAQRTPGSSASDSASDNGSDNGSGSASAGASASGVGSGPQARFEFVPGSDHQPATVRAVGDIDLTNAAQFSDALGQAASTSSAITADMTAVTYCDSAAIRALFNAATRARLTIHVTATGAITQSLLEVSGLDQIATVVTLK